MPTMRRSSEVALSLLSTDRDPLVSADAVRPIEVLLVEDDEHDARLTREGLEAGKVLNRLTVLSDGAAVIPYLRGAGEHAGAPRPDLVLLDLNLPGRDGRQVLADIKSARRGRGLGLPGGRRLRYASCPQLHAIATAGGATPLRVA
jgi:CheY-like chemotaxis protein